MIGTTDKWFYWYSEEISKEKDWGAPIHNRHFCPCCLMPTLEARAQFEICPICSWEDDGQDDDDSEIIRNGVNGKYSLEEARENFKKYDSVYRPDDSKKPDFLNRNKNLRMKLFESFSHALNSGEESDWKTAVKLQNEVVFPIS